MFTVVVLLNSWWAGVEQLVVAVSCSYDSRLICVTQAR